MPIRSGRSRLAAVLLATTALAAGPLAAQNSVVRVDSLLVFAERAVIDGRPWEATRLLAPLVQIPAARSPSALEMAARAAAGWGGWATVVRLLKDEAWLDAGDGSARALLARAHLERGELDPALGSARLAVANPRATDAGERALVLARALDRADRLDSAALFYRRAAAELPGITDWLALRAAGVTTDSTRRDELLRSVSDSVARRRIPWTEALARKRSGDLIGAARLYDSLGDRVTAIELRLATGDTAARRAGRTALVALFQDGAGSDDTRRAIELFDRDFSKGGPLEELALARRAALVGQLDRSAEGFTRAGAARLTDRDRFTYATVLSRLGRYDEAVPLFGSIRTPSLRGDAAYQRARAILRSGKVAAALQALRRVVVRHPDDADAAATALYLTGDLLIDREGDDSARAVFREAATRYPKTVFGRRAGFQAAMIAYLDEDFTTAALEFDALARGEAPGDETVSGLYWAGRAHAAVGDSVGARARWEQVLTRGRDTYYAGLAARRLGTRAWTYAAPGSPPSAGPLPAALDRAITLARLGLRVEAAFEIDGYADGAGSSPSAVRTAARSLAEARLYGRSVRLAFRAQAAGTAADRDLAELLHPLPFRAALTAEADSASVDPFLVAALIRQESAFDANARSAADARGLMQVLPSVGESYARGMGLSDWDPVLLYQPGVNLNFGIRHLSEGLSRYQRPEQALAAFNAGAQRVDRWLELRGVTGDPEVFVERIPFTETRDYVRRVMRNFAVYRALYGADRT